MSGVRTPGTPGEAGGYAFPPKAGGCSLSHQSHLPSLGSVVVFGEEGAAQSKAPTWLNLRLTNACLGDGQIEDPESLSHPLFVGRAQVAIHGCFSHSCMV